MVLQAFRKRWVGVGGGGGVAVCGGELFGVQRAGGSGRSSRDLEALRRQCFYVLFIFQFILHIKTAPPLLWPIEAVKPLKCFVGEQVQLLIGVPANR